MTRPPARAAFCYPDMVRLGITGGIGAGKSTAARLLMELGVAVVDTDDLARAVVEPGSPGLAEVVSAFGTGILLPGGGLDRGGLARRIFSSDSDRRVLEGILHPRIHQRWMAWLNRAAVEGIPMAAVVIPLLFEKGYAPEFDRVVTVGCTDRTQRSRLRIRGWSDSEIAARIAAQWPMEGKMSAADRVVWNEGCEEKHRCQWRRILAELRTRVTCSRA